MTPRKLAPGRLVVASHNAGKVREINELISSFGMSAISAGELGLGEPEETETRGVALCAHGVEIRPRKTAQPC